MPKTICRHCGGKGWTLTRPYDRFGAAQEQRRQLCYACDGAGVCEDGDMLSPATKQTAPPEHAADLARRGCPAWA